MSRKIWSRKEVQTNPFSVICLMQETLVKYGLYYDIAEDALADAAEPVHSEDILYIIIYEGDDKTAAIELEALGYKETIIVVSGYGVSVWVYADNTAGKEYLERV